MHQNQNDGGELEELGELDFDLQDRQLDGRFQEQIGMRYARDRDHEIGHDGKKYQPARVRRIRRMVDSLEQTVGIDGGFNIHRTAAQIRHMPSNPQRYALIWPGRHHCGRRQIAHPPKAPPALTKP